MICWLKIESFPLVSNPFDFFLSNARRVFRLRPPFKVGEREREREKEVIIIL